MNNNKYFNAAVLKAELDGYVIGQDVGARRVAMAVSSHLNRIYAHERNKNSRVRKDNVLLAGPTGCGKTETFRVLRRLEEKLGIPVIMRNAPDYAPNDNWKGNKDLVWLVKDLFTEANNLYKRLYGEPCTEEEFDAVCRMASNGIILLDEFDKMRITENNTENFCRDYQATLLKMTEGSEYLAGRVNLQDDDEDDKENNYELKVDTSGVMFVFLGTFDGMEKITRNRLLQEKRKKEGAEKQGTKGEPARIGFTAELKPEGNKEGSAEKEELPAGTDLTPNLEDMIEYGIMRELAGRIAIRVNYRALSVADLVKIMLESKTSVYFEYQERFANMGHKLTADQSALREIAHIAAEEKTGARGLSNIFSDLLFNTMYTLSGTAEPTECLLLGSDIKAHRPPQLRKLSKPDAKKRWGMQGW
jgi:ATP-dependent Clp protease ATP-binding subunit ClpX